MSNGERVNSLALARLARPSLGESVPHSWTGLMKRAEFSAFQWLDKLSNGGKTRPMIGSEIDDRTFPPSTICHHPVEPGEGGDA